MFTEFKKLSLHKIRRESRLQNTFATQNMCYKKPEGYHKPCNEIEQIEMPVSSNFEIILQGETVKNHWLKIVAATQVYHIQAIVRY